MKEYGVGIIGFGLWVRPIPMVTNHSLYYEDLPFAPLIGVCTAHRNS